MANKAVVKAAIYVRVSTDDQKHDLQLTELREFVQRMGWEAVEYPEKGSAVKVRPVFNQLVADARLRRFDVVLVWKLDRFARSLRQLVDTIFLLNGLGIRFMAVTQGIDKDKNNPISQLLMHVLGAVAEFERGLIVERVKAGMTEAKRRGKKLGRSKRVFRRDHARELRDQGLSLRAISRKLGVPVSTIVDSFKTP